MLDSWAINNSKLKKKIIGNLFEYSNLKHADCLHALCESEYISIRELGLSYPVAIIPNGIKPIKYHQPVLSISCNLLKATAREGSNVATTKIIATIPKSTGLPVAASRKPMVTEAMK